MGRTISASPRKVHLLRADPGDVAVQDIIQTPSVEIDVESRSIQVSGDGRSEQGSMLELVASARGLKVTCGEGDGERRSLHLAFDRPEELDELVAGLESGGFEVTRSRTDPEYRE